MNIHFYSALDIRPLLLKLNDAFRLLQVQGLMIQGWEGLTMMMTLEDCRGLLKMRTLNSLVGQKMGCLNDSSIQMSQKLLHLPIWVGK